MCIIDRFCKKSITLTVVLLIFVVCLQREKSSNNMKYEFNTKRFAELIAERKLKKNNVSRILGRKNSSTVQNWIDGKKIESTHLIEICNSLDVNPAEFFLCDGQPIVPPENAESTSNANKTAMSDLNQAKIAFLHERLEFEKERFMFQKQKTSTNLNKCKENYMKFAMNLNENMKVE